jgi:glycerol 2-dehydrogenase (NADP+)
MNQNGNHPLFPRLPDGSRDIDQERTKNWIDTWHDMEALLGTGKAKAIGMSNCSAPFLKELVKQAKVIPAVDQIENHPYLPQEDIVELAKQHGIVVTAYSPLGSSDSPLLEHAAVKEIAEKHGVSATTVLLSYGGASRSPV